MVKYYKASEIDSEIKDPVVIIELDKTELSNIAPFICNVRKVIQQLNALATVRPAANKILLFLCRLIPRLVIFNVKGLLSIRKKTSNYQKGSGLVLSVEQGMIEM